MKQLRSGARLSSLYLVLGVVATLASGCGVNHPTSPMEMSVEEMTSNPGPKPGGALADSMESTWSTLASVWVNKGEAKSVVGGRYQIQFVNGSLAQGAQISIMERNAQACDVKVEPSGMGLSKAATLTINYAGSAQEFSATSLKLYRLNDATGVWSLVSGTNSISTRKFSAKVTVLGRYMLSSVPPGKAGW